MWNARFLALFSVVFTANRVDPNEILVNSHRDFLFGDVLEPLCSLNLTVGTNLTSSEVTRLFHSWQNVTSSQIAATSPISEFRKAMPCFPGPNVTTTSSDGSGDVLLPVYPSCEQFVNLSTTTIAEVRDLLEEAAKGRGSRVDVSLKTVMSSLSRRLQNLIDFLPDGATKNSTKELLSSLVGLNSRPMLAEPMRQRVDVSQLLSCLNITPVSLLNVSRNQSIGSIVCTYLSMCSFASLASNDCLARFNVSEDQYDWVANRTIGDVMKGLTEGRGGRGKRRTPAPPRRRGEDYLEETLLSSEEVVSEGRFNVSDSHEGSGEDPQEGSGEGRFDGRIPVRSEGSGEEEDLGNSTDTSDLLSMLGSLDPKSDDISTVSPGNAVLQSLLSFRLNSSLLQFAASDLTDTSLKQKILAAVQKLGTSEFTIEELWKELRGVIDSSELLQLLGALKSALGGSSQVAIALETLESSGIDVETLLNTTGSSDSNPNLSSLMSSFSL